MEIAARIIDRELGSVYLKSEVEKLKRICDDLKSLNQKWSLTNFQRTALTCITQVMEEMKYQHENAVSKVIAAEKEALNLKEKAKTILDQKTSTLNTAGRVALVVFDTPFFLERGQLKMNSDAKYVVEDLFKRSINSLVHQVISDAKDRNAAIEVAVEDLWSRFINSRDELEKKVSGRIRAFEKQLAVAAEVVLIDSM